MEVLFDNLVTCAKIPLWRAHNVLLKKCVCFSQTFYQKRLGIVNINSTKKNGSGYELPIMIDFGFSPKK